MLVSVSQSNFPFMHTSICTLHNDFVIVKILYLPIEPLKKGHVLFSLAHRPLPVLSALKNWEWPGDAAMFVHCREVVLSSDSWDLSHGSLQRGLENNFDLKGIVSLVPRPVGL